MTKSFDGVKVSVIVPVYNIDGYVERCLLSLVNQSLQEIEIICIDDDSVDKSGAILDKYQAEYPEKIKVFHIENKGVSNARNVGLKAATGEYIGFVDGDDYVCCNMFEKLYNKAVQEQSDIVSSPYIVLGEKKSRRMHMGDMQYYGKSVYECPELLTSDVSFLWNKIFKREMLEEYSLYFEDFRIFEDMLFVDKAFLSANSISKVNEPFYYYRRVRIGSATNVFSQKLFDLFDALELLLDFYKKQNAFEKFYNQLLFIALNHSFVRHRTVVPYDENLIKLKLEFLDKSFAFLDSNFPDWKDNDYYYSLREGNKENCTDIDYWKEYIKYSAVLNLPEEFKEKAEAIKKRTNANFAQNKKTSAPADEMTDDMLVDKYSQSLAVECNPTGERKTLIFAGNMFNNPMTDDLQSSLYKSNECSVVTFSSRQILPNFSVIDALPSKSAKYCTGDEFADLKESDKEFVEKALKNPLYFKLHKRKVMSLMKNKFNMLYGVFGAGRVVFYSGKYPFFTALFASADCERILIIPDKSAFSKRLNHTVYKLFDQIFYADDEVLKELKKAGHKNIKKFNTLEKLL